MSGSSPRSRWRPGRAADGIPRVPGVFTDPLFDLYPPEVQVLHPKVEIGHTVGRWVLFTLWLWIGWHTFVRGWHFLLREPR